MVDLIGFFRVKDWLHMLGLILLGFVYAPHDAGSSRLPLALLVGCLYLAHGYSLNDIYDGQIKTRASYPQALFWSLASLGLCLAGSVLISPAFFCVALFGHLCGMFYSARPFRFKNKLWLDLVFNAFSLAPLFLLGTLTDSGLSVGSVVVTMLMFLYFVPIQLLHQISDNASDRELSQKNSFQILGLEKTLKVLRASLVFYAFANLILWKLSFLSLFSSIAGIAFATALLVYIHRKLSPEAGLDSAALKRAKIDSRYISIVYGLLLFVSFSRVGP